MISIDLDERDSLELFKQHLHKYMIKNKLRHSQQREHILSTLHKLSKPVTAQKLKELVNNDGNTSISYPTTIRQINFFKFIGFLIVVNKVHKLYVLRAKAEITA